jgi:hypothetical protein
MKAVLVLIIYLGPFLVIGLVARPLVRSWMRRRDVDLSIVQAQMGSRREKRRVFLLGAWRNEGPDR